MASPKFQSILGNVLGKVVGDGGYGQVGIQAQRGGETTVERSGKHRGGFAAHGDQQREVGLAQRIPGRPPEGQSRQVITNSALGQMALDCNPSWVLAGVRLGKGK